MLCDNCLHKPVCGKFRATGGQVQKCDHLLEQKRGRWTQECKNRRRCSNCNMGRNTDTQLEWDHCPRCGAKMENTSKFTRVWDEEKGKFVFKPAEEVPEPNWCCVYGDYAQCKEDEIQKAKAELLEQMIDTIRDLAKKDEFWIVKEKDGGYTVAWKAEFPQMLPSKHMTSAPEGNDYVISAN